MRADDLAATHPRGRAKPGVEIVLGERKREMGRDVAFTILSLYRSFGFFFWFSVIFFIFSLMHDRRSPRASSR